MPTNEYYGPPITYSKPNGGDQQAKQSRQSLCGVFVQPFDLYRTKKIYDFGP